MGHSLYLSHNFETSLGGAIFGHDMLFDILFVANWNKIGDYRQRKTDIKTARKIACGSIMITRLAISFW
jgi:hypothetical protein